VVTRSRHRDVLAYKLAAALADQIHAAATGWNQFDRWTVGIQLVRAADSVGANVAEAFGRGSIPDQRRLLYIARGSLLETEHWIDRATRRGMLASGDFDQPLAELARVLTGLIRSERLHPA
jgi:four helix bundle protein